MGIPDNKRMLDLDGTAAGISKWDGIKRLAALEQIRKDDIIAVGNFYNDLDMIRHVAVGVAVANSPEEVKQYQAGIDDSASVIKSEEGK